MTIAHDLLNFAALILAGIAGALLAPSFGRAMRLAVRQVRVDGRRR